MQFRQQYVLEDPSLSSDTTVGIQWRIRIPRLAPTSFTRKPALQTIGGGRSSIRSTTGSKNPSSACTRRTEEFDTDGITSARWPEQVRRRGGGGVRLGEEGAAELCPNKIQKSKQVATRCRKTWRRPPPPFSARHKAARCRDMRGAWWRSAQHYAQDSDASSMQWPAAVSHLRRATKRGQRTGYRARGSRRLAPTSFTRKPALQTIGGGRSSIRSTTGSKNPSSACTRRTEEFDTDGITSARWPEQVRRRGGGGVRLGEEGAAELCSGG
ncbi:hypothetical protein F511_06809 [Dorcoceras hygrometricum]|uniref:Uncharacterized protein n=1 Tax=Dorcoceras hygrometricum TaxID=472368 RepID=A0A2Z7CE12_9LAMI|nr:hypothetical protein F511_06809 [Dorcoceras hygrometricum]